MSYPAPPPASQPPERGGPDPSDRHDLAAGRSVGGASPSGTGSTVGQATSFFNDLFDVRFTRFVSLRLISVVYVVILVAVSLLALAVIFTGFAGGALTGLFALVLAALGWVIYVVLARVALEAFAVLFRIHDDTSRMAEALGGAARPGDPAQGPTGGGGYDSGGFPASGQGGGYGGGAYGGTAYGSGGGYGGPPQDPNGPPWV